MVEIIKKEGNYKEWTYQSKNGVTYRCEIKRNPDWGFLCGYVEIDEDNNLYGKSYEEIDLDVHGGLTYGRYHVSNKCLYGFDCGHFGDIYRDMNYVTKECEKLAEQFSKYSISAERNMKIDSFI
jgi:hypothetical protein